MNITLMLPLVALAAVSFGVSGRAHDADGFFRGFASDGAPPGLLALTFSQVTTWIFARSLLTAAILGYYYGIAGGLAYAAYYLSFLIGGAAVDAIRFRHGFASIQTFLADRFGATGTWCYNVVVGVRLLSEVFANLLVIGLIFGVAGSAAYATAIFVLSLATLGYSMMGGLRASIRTDVFQMAAFLVVMAAILYFLFAAPGWSWGAVATSSPAAFDHGWNLLIVALLQIWSYPLHDPVMMDRGFLADRRTTRLSFVFAAALSIVCILAFSLLGVHAGLHAEAGEVLQTTLTRLLGPTAMTLISLALIISAVSTLDSTLSSAAKLVVVDMGATARTVANGRIAMALFMLGGVVFLFSGNNDLYSAVAVSGTASLFLAPVLLFSIWGGRRDVPVWSFATAFASALSGAVLYYLESTGRTDLLGAAFGVAHKYDKLLLICVAVLAIGFGAFALGCLLRRPRTAANEV